MQVIRIYIYNNDTPGFKTSKSLGYREEATIKTLSILMEFGFFHQSRGVFQQPEWI